MITNREQQIVILRESGMSTTDIAQQMGLSDAYVRGRVAYLCSGLGIDRSHERSMAVGSEALLVAIQRARAEGELA